MDIQLILTICSIVACIFSILALLLGFVALLKIMSLEKSTHSVQYMPVEENWASSDDEVKDINKEFKEINEDIIGL